MKMVKFWDGSMVRATDRKDAIKKVIDGLNEWMQSGDRIVWHFSSDSKRIQTPREPDVAIVVNSVCEYTDARAQVI
jgi:hypothetical protein